MTDNAALTYVNAVVAAARKQKKLKELASFLTYFSAAQELAQITGLSEATLQTLKMVSPANAPLSGIEFHR
jgi:hypothetical protein